MATYNRIVLKEHAVLLVKLHDVKDYEFPKWVEYRANKGRNLKAVQKWLSSLDAFRYCIIFAYNRKTKVRGSKIGYIDKYSLQY